MKNAFDSLNSKLKTVMEKVSEHEDMSIEISKTEKQREKRYKEKTEYPKTVGQLQMLLNMHNRNTMRTRRQKDRKKKYLKQ